MSQQISLTQSLNAKAKCRYLEVKINTRSGELRGEHDNARHS